MHKGWDPLRDLVVLQDRMNRLFRDAAEKRAGEEEDNGGQDIERADWHPAADVYEVEGAYVIAVDLPGIDRSGLEIDLDNDRLVIRGERAPDGEGRHRRERPHGRFLRRFVVPANVDQKSISAEYKDGVLRVRLPRRTEPTARKVEIKIQ